MIPVRAPFFLRYLYPSLLWRVPSKGNDLYLTFDDGPVEGPTEFVLETLAATDSTATFFCIGDNIRKYPDVFASIVANGHTVANHTYNHLNAWRTPLSVYLENVQACSEEMRRNRYHSSAPMFFRPPYGRITWRGIRALRDYRIVMWDVLTKDFSPSVSPEECLRNSIAATRPGSIIVFHDSLKAEKNLRHVLPRFIRHFRDRGYVFKALSQ